MTNYEQAQMKRNGSICTILNKNASIFEDDVSFCAIATKMQEDTDTVVANSAAAETNNKGYSMAKYTAKNEASELAADLCANSQVKLNLLNNLILSKSLNSAITFYSKASDATCSSRLMSVYKVMEDNIEIITSDYLTAGQLADLLAKINKFTNLASQTGVVNSGATVLTKQFKTAMKATNANVKTIIKLVNKYEKTNPTFYSVVMAACKLPTVTKLNTSVSIDVFDAESKGVLAKVAGTLTKSKHKPFSNVAGVMLYINVLAGTATLSFSLKDYITKLLTINIKRGRMNKFTVYLTPGTMTTEEEATIKATLASIIAEAKAKLTAKKKKRKDARTAAALLKK